MKRSIPDLIELIKQNKLSYITSEEWTTINELIYVIAEAFEMKNKKIRSLGDEFMAIVRMQLGLED